VTRKTPAVILAMAALAVSSCGGGGGGPPPTACGGGAAGNKGGGPVISGQAKYEHLQYDQNGLTGAVTDLPIRFATVEVLQNGNTVASGATDGDGNYSVSAPGTSGTIYVRVDADAAPPFLASVEDASGACYSVRSPDAQFTAGSSLVVNLLASEKDAGPVFNILDDLIRAQDVGNSLAGRYPQKITAVWYPGNTTGTFYDTGTGKINILGALTVGADGSGGSDAYDDAVILHEMGHYTAANFSKDDSPGGNHSITKHYPDIRLTWSEGWATFFSSMSRSLRPITGALVGPQWYVDTPGWPGLAGPIFSFEIDTPTFSSVATGADNEQAVSNVLWHIFAASGASTTGPYLGLGATDIWSVFSTYLPTVQHLSPAEYVTLEAFWDGWVAKFPPQEIPLTPILSDRKIVYSPDQYEPDDSIAQARLVSTGMNETHTFFKGGADPNGDKDYFKINVASGNQYAFLTSVSNGADTMLTLFDADGATMLAQNDDIDPVNDPNNKGSKIVWTANATKTVYLLCEPYRPYVPADIFLYPAVGGSSPAITRYGTYAITITSP
jgi:hypothetical protein